MSLDKFELAMFGDAKLTLSNAVLLSSVAFIFAPSSPAKIPLISKEATLSSIVIMSNLCFDKLNLKNNGLYR